jgi:hypothetical protein
LSSGQGATVSAGDFVATSDGTLKTNIQNIDNPLDILMNINGYRYNWNDTAVNLGYLNDKDQLGVIAQEVEKVAPELIATINGLKQVSYTKLVPILIEAIKELNNKINKQQ